MLDPVLLAFSLMESLHLVGYVYSHSRTGGKILCRCQISRRCAFLTLGIPAPLISNLSFGSEKGRMEGWSLFHLMTHSPNAWNRSLELIPGLPRGWQELSYLIHHAVPPCAYQREAASKAKLGLASRILTWETRARSGASPAFQHTCLSLAVLISVLSHPALYNWLHEFCDLVFKNNFSVVCLFEIWGKVEKGRGTPIHWFTL